MRDTNLKVGGRGRKLSGAESSQAMPICPSGEGVLVSKIDLCQT
jgi:hypothetical protein